MQSQRPISNFDDEGGAEYRPRAPIDAIYSLIARIKLVPTTGSPFSSASETAVYRTGEGDAGMESSHCAQSDRTGFPPTRFMWRLLEEEKLSLVLVRLDDAHLVALEEELGQRIGTIRA